MWESRYNNLEGSERQASDKAKRAAAEIARLQSELNALAASKDATNNAELTRNKATLTELERAVTEARKNESEARLELQEATQIYESKIRQLEKDNLIANELAQVRRLIENIFMYAVGMCVRMDLLNLEFLDIR
jgi:hypothetical protein